MWFKNKYFLLFVLILLIRTGAIAQENGTGIKLFFEKVYLHTDRSFYAGGDNIWFKAYLVNAQSNYPVATSNTLYTELIDPFNTIISRQVIRIDSGYGIGDFRLDDSIAGGSYRIRAYTNWMKNFGSYFIFEKQVEVKSIVELNKKNEVVKKAADGTTTASVPRCSIQFFPEGGSMVEGISSLIGFKATDGYGNAVNASGSIVSASGDTVAHFKSSHLGMGNFNFTPLPGVKYQTLVQYPQQTAFLDFITALSNGYVMKVIHAETGAVQLQVLTNAASPGEITIAAKHGGRILYKEKLVLKDGQAAITIATKDFPAGICSITVYDDKLRPNCERLIYIPESDPLIVNINTNKNNYISKEKITVDISVTNSQRQPVKAILSLAAVNDDLEKTAAENISTYLLLQTEVRGKIENPMAYFDETNPQRLQQLDLLLLTQGWRDFLWRKMADTGIAIHYMPEQGISISGKVTYRTSQKALPDVNVSLQAPAAKGDKWFTTKTDAQGNYFLDGIPLYGVQTLKIAATNDKGEKTGQLFMDSLFGKPLPELSNKWFAYDSSAFTQFAKDALKRYTVEKNNKWVTLLPAVTVETKKKTVFLRDGPYMNYGKADEFTITPADYSYDDLRNYLAKKVPGAIYDMERDGIYFMASGKSIRPRFVVDKREDVFDRLDYYSLRMDQIQSVSVRHMIGPPSFTRTEREDGTVRDIGASMVDIVVIYLVLKPGAHNQEPSKIITEVNGYYEAKVFYAPDYKIDKDVPDERTTIHWAPLIVTDENGKARLSFYNADPKATIRIDVQGLTTKGKTIVAEKKYQVQ